MQIAVTPSSPAVASFLARNNVSIVVASPSSNVLLLLGCMTSAPGKTVLSWSLCAVEEPRALLTRTVEDGEPELWVAGGKRDVIHRFARVLDRRFNVTPQLTFADTYVLRQSFHVGAHDIRALCRPSNEEIAFVSARYNAVCTLGVNRPSLTTNILWHPPFISKPLKAENRCNVSGVAFSSTGDVALATSTSESDVAGAWREHVRAGGVVLIDGGKATVRGLSLPCAPRVHNGVRWVLNAGTGELGRIESDNEFRFVPCVQFPGFVQDMVFVGDSHALVTSSAIVPPDVDLVERLEKRKASPQCAIFIVNLITESIVEHITITGTLVRELTSIATLAGSPVRVLSVTDESGDAMGTVTDFSETTNDGIKEDEDKDEDEEKIKQSL